MVEYGYLYCISNYTIQGILNIGMTTEDPKQKLEEANRYTFILPVCKLEFAKKVKNPYETGEILQKILQKHKIALNTHFYRVSLDEIKLLFELPDGEMINYNSDL